MASGPFSFLLSAPSWPTSGPRRRQQFSREPAGLLGGRCHPFSASSIPRDLRSLHNRLQTGPCGPYTTAIGGQQLANLFKRGEKGNPKSIPSTLPISSAGRGHLLLRVKGKKQKQKQKVGVGDVIMYMSVDSLAVVAPLLPSCLFGTPKKRHQVTFLRFNMF